MTSTIWWTIAGCTVVTAVIKAFGPVVMGGRELPDRLQGVIVLLAPALLAALVVTAALADGATGTSVRTPSACSSAPRSWSSPGPASSPQSWSPPS